MWFCGDTSVKLILEYNHWNSTYFSCHFIGCCAATGKHVNRFCIWIMFRWMLMNFFRMVTFSYVLREWVLITYWIIFDEDFSVYRNKRYFDLWETIDLYLLVKTYHIIAKCDLKDDAKSHRAQNKQSRRWLVLIIKDSFAV